MSAFTQSDIQEDAKAALIEARGLNERAIREGAVWTIAKEHLSKAERFMNEGNHQGALAMANKAIRFLSLGLEQKKQPLYEHRE